MHSVPEPNVIRRFLSQLTEACKIENALLFYVCSFMLPFMGYHDEDVDPFFIQANMLFTTCFFTWWVASKVVHHDFQVKTNTVLNLFGLIMVYILGYNFIDTFVNSFYSYLPVLYASKFLFLFLAYNLFQKRHTLLLIRFFYYSFFVSLIGLLPPFAKIFSMAEGIRFASFFYEPNVYAHFLSLVCAMSILFWKENKKFIHIFIAITASGVLIFTLSRSGYLTLLLLAIMALYFGYFRGKTKIGFRTIFIFVVFLSGLGFASFMGLKARNNDTVSASLSTVGRLSLNAAGIKIIQGHPLFGVGTANSEKHVHKFQDKRLPIIGDAVVIHNTYILMGAEWGLIILFIYGIILLKLTRYPKKDDSIYHILAFIIIVSHIFHGLFFPIEFQLNMYWITILMVLLIYRDSSSINEDSRSQSKHESIAN